jgi:cysteine desulfurase/selenocysteine lyase
LNPQPSTLNPRPSTFIDLPPRIYLDNAATSWPKPESVYAAVDQYQRQLGAAAGRSAYCAATEAERAVQAARAAVAQLIGVDNPKRIVLTLNGTDSLNLAIHGLLRPGSHVVTTVVEHNSVLRPLRRLEETVGVEVTRVTCNDQGIVDWRAVAAALRPETALVAMVHASNVTGAVQPIAEVGELLRPRRAWFLVDAAQSLGHLPISATDLGIDLLAAPGHKGLLGPLGTGILYVGTGVEEELESTRQGGTGTRSDEDLQPNSLPEKYEAGNHNLPGIVGLAAGATYVLNRGVAAIGRHIDMLLDRLWAGLAPVTGVRLLGPPADGARVAVVSLLVEGYDPQEIAAILDAAYHIQVRAGYHCAPALHRAIGSAGGGGTLRLSPGPFTTPEEIDGAIAALTEIAATAR